MYTNKRLNKNKSVSINITAGVQKLNKIIIMNRVLKESVHPNYNTNNLNNNNKKETNIKNDSGRPMRTATSADASWIKVYETFYL